MVLDARLRKLATGISARQAAQAYVRSRRGAELSEADRAGVAEFEATIELMFLMAAVDGKITSDEVSQLAASVQAIMDMSGERVPLDLDKTLAGLNEKLDRDGWKVRLDDAAARLESRESRTFAFRLAAGVAFIDDHVAHAEAAAIDAVAAALGLPPDVSQDILVDVQEALFVD